MNVKISALTIAALTALAVLAGCDDTSRATNSAREQAAVAANQESLLTKQPPHYVDHSLERDNLNKRLDRINSQNMSGFIYLISQGQVMASYSVAGKVSSLNSYLASSEAVEHHTDAGGGNISVEQPDFDGAYGKNYEGIFFFTADTDAYVEWGGEYLFSDQPLKLNTEPRLLREVKDK